MTAIFDYRGRPMMTRQEFVSLVESHGAIAEQGYYGGIEQVSVTKGTQWLGYVPVEIAVFDDQGNRIRNIPSVVIELTQYVLERLKKA